MIASELIFVGAWCAIKTLGRNLPLFEVVFFRSAASLPLLIPLIHLRRRSFIGKAWGMLFLRSLFGFIAMISAFYAMIHMSIGNASTLINSMPIFVAILAPITLREPMHAKQLILILGSFVGIGILMKPNVGIFETASIYGLSAAIFASFAMLCVRKLRMTDSALIITFYFTAFSTIASTPLAIISFVWPTSTQWLLIAFISITATAAQIFLTRAYRLGHAATIAPFSFTSVLGCFIAGIIIFDEIPDTRSIFGAIIVVASGVGIMLLAPAKQKAAQESTV